ncbi:MAG: hypothetical protein JWN04_3356 [Myxococcaceae bacterium]|nr:hypothetical protein [Myxococcaceae bacterium]
MGEFKVDAHGQPGIVALELRGQLTGDEMRAFVVAHNQAIESLRGAPYRVFCDLRAMLPLSPEASQFLHEAKSFSAAQPNFQGSAVLTASSLVAMQHRRTSVETGIMETELISDNEAACWDYLRRIQRSRR